MEWKSIETAPMDGTEFIGGNKEGECEIGSIGANGSFFSKYNDFVPASRNFIPTHWIPIPERPD